LLNLYNNIHTGFWAQSFHVMWKVGTSKVVAPMSVKDRWVGPRKQVLNVLIACQRYQPCKPCSLPSTEGGFTPTTSMSIFGRETGYELMDRSAVVLWIGSGALFLGSSASVHHCW
jgi:hypothetical protein